MRKFLTSTFAMALLAAALPAMAEEGPALEHQSWAWQGPFGRYDKAQLRRGFQVYREICSNCHSLKLVAYRNLAVTYKNQSKQPEAEGVYQDLLKINPGWAKPLRDELDGTAPSH